MMKTLLEVKNISHSYKTKHGLLRVLDSVTFTVAEGETLGIAGESGSGKSTLLRILSAQEEPQKGTVRFDDFRVWPSANESRKDFFRQIGIVFQQPQLSFDPRWTLYRSLEEPLLIHEKGLSADKRQQIVYETAQKSGLSENILQMKPDRLSGGQLQRAAIARAIILKPRLVFLDEPTAALDVSIQAQILNLLKELQQQENMAYVFVSHDIAVLAYIAHRLMILKRGRTVEAGEARTILNNPKTKYTQTLLASVLE